MGLNFMERDIERVEQVYRAHAKGDVNAILQLLSPEVELVQSPELPWGGRYLGREGAAQFIKTLREKVDARLQVEQLIDAGDQVVVFGFTKGKARETGLEFEIPVVHVWTFSQGQIVRFEAYIDNPTMLAALGL
jgi:uncharacterized protein